MLSIIIPALNEEKYIENCLKSIKSQDYDGKYETIVSDGGSKDRTVSIARKYADKVIIAERKGIAAGRNIGAGVARGDVLIFLDADTVLVFNTLSELSKALKKKNVVGASCPIVPLSAKARDFFIYWFYDQFAKATIEKNPHIAGMCCAYRKEVFEKAGGFDEKLKTYEDIELANRISKFGKIAFVENTIALTSPRRIERWGSRKAIQRYVASYMRYVLTGKGMNLNKYKPVR